MLQSAIRPIRVSLAIAVAILSFSSLLIVFEEQHLMSRSRLTRAAFVPGAVLFERVPFDIAVKHARLLEALTVASSLAFWTLACYVTVLAVRRSPLTKPGSTALR